MGPSPVVTVEHALQGTEVMLHRSLLHVGVKTLCPRRCAGVAPLHAADGVSQVVGDVAAAHDDNALLAQVAQRLGQLSKYSVENCLFANILRILVGIYRFDLGHEVVRAKLPI